MIRASDLTASAQGSRILVVGAGFAGAVSARVLAEAGHRVHVVERRDHVGGNAFDTADAAGVLVHRYGPHIFHTDSKRIFDFLSRFTTWRPCEHRVRAVIGDRTYPFPVNLDTLRALYGADLDERTVEHGLAEVVEPRPALKSFEDAALASVGRDLYERFFRDYTRITEFRHLTGQAHSGTSIVREYPQACGDPYYPVPGPDSEALYKKYRALADREARVVFVGRLA